MFENLFLDQCWHFVLGYIVVQATISFWPLIKLIEQFEWSRDLYYRWIFGSYCAAVSRTFTLPKKKMFNLLASDMRKTKIDRVVEIGPGTGDSFKYYETPVKLTAVELNPVLMKHSENLAEQFPNVKITKCLVASAESMHMIESESVDYVVGTMILCCIKDPNAALREIHRILKPNGRYYFCESSCFDQSSSPTMQVVQKLFGYCWRLFFLGCKGFLQNVDEIMKKNGFVYESRDIHIMPESIIKSEIYYGCALKI